MFEDEDVDNYTASRGEPDAKIFECEEVLFLCGFVVQIATAHAPKCVGIRSVTGNSGGNFERSLGTYFYGGCFFVTGRRLGRCPVDGSL